MASVQELLLAAQSKQSSPFISLMEGLAKGVQTSYKDAPAREHQQLTNQKLQFDMEQEKATLERAKEQSDILMARMRGGTESEIQNRLRRTAPYSTPATPGLRVKALKLDKYGFLQGDYEEPAPKSLKTENYFDPTTKKNRVATFDPLTGAWDRGPHNPLAPESQGSSRVDTSMGLMKVYLADKIREDYNTVRGQVDGMDAMFKDAMSGNHDSKVVLDQGLISMFNKITDPRSVVRESEYERTPENIALFNRIKGWSQRLTQGGAGLTDEDRALLVRGAKVIANSKGKNYAGVRDRFNTLAAKKGLDPELVTGTDADFTPFVLDEIPVGGTKTGTTSSGKTFKAVKR